MQPRFVDLHTHTWASDGSDSPAQLVHKAAEAHLAAIAVTDHDTVAGVAEAVEAGQRLGVEVIGGCELSVNSPYGEVHILGLWLPVACQQLEEQLLKLRAARETRNRQIVNKLVGLGCSLTYGDVLDEAGGESVGRPHIARAMLKKGFGCSMDDVFRRFLGKYGLAFEPKAILEPEEGVRLLAGLGATVGIAHPMLVRCPQAWFEAFVLRLQGAGLSAIEAYHSEHSAKDERYCVDLAARLGLGLTGGSDYHGVAKPAVRLGRGKGALRVTEAMLDRLKTQRLAQGLPV